MFKYTDPHVFLYQGKLTYGKVGEWRFDKRNFSGGAPPKNLTLPPPGVPETVVRSTTVYNFCYVFVVAEHHQGIGECYVFGIASLVFQNEYVLWNRT